MGDGNYRPETRGEDPSVDSVTTDSASVSNAPSGDNDVLRWQEGIEIGDVTVTDGSGLGGSGNNDFSSRANATVSVTFGSAFAGTPNIILTINRTNGDAVFDGTLSFDSQDSSGFRALFRQWGNTDHDSNNNSISADYHATEGR